MGFWNQWTRADTLARDPDGKEAALILTTETNRQADKLGLGVVRGDAVFDESYIGTNCRHLRLLR